MKKGHPQKWTGTKVIEEQTPRPFDSKKGTKSRATMFSLDGESAEKMVELCRKKKTTVHALMATVISFAMASIFR